MMRILPNINKNYICISLNIVYNFYLIIKYNKVKNIKYKNQILIVLPIIINISKQNKRTSLMFPIITKIISFKKKKKLMNMHQIVNQENHY